MNNHLLGFCKFCNDYTSGEHNKHGETDTKILFWHVCGICAVSTDSFTQKLRNDSNAHIGSHTPADSTTAPKVAA